MKKNKTLFAKKEGFKRDWFIVDAGDKVLGRVAVKVATYLCGKHKPIFTSHVDCGDFIVVVNADKIRVTGKKESQKTYFRHSGYPGGARLITFEKMMQKDPTKVIRHAVAGMLPKNRLGRQMITKLKVYVGDQHPHGAQKPKNLRCSKYGRKKEI